MNELLIGLGITAFFAVIGFAVKLILDRGDITAEAMNRRFDGLDAELKLHRERLHDIRDWMAARTTVDEVKRIFGDRQ